jgi:hypothetical protein
LAVVTQKHIDFMDSAAGIVKAMEMQDIGAFISEELDNQHRKVRVMAVPQQPPHSNECGLHVALNAVLAAHNFVQVKRPLHQQRVVSYDSLMTYVGMYVEGSIPTSRLLKAIWGQLAINAIPLMTHEDVREQLDAFAARDIRNFKVGWIGYPDSGPTMLEWSGTLRKKERRSWRVAFAENEGTSLVPYKELAYLYLEPDTHELYDDLTGDQQEKSGAYEKYLNCGTPFKVSPLDGDNTTYEELKTSFKELKDQEWPMEMEFSLAKTTRKKHRQMLRHILEEIPQRLHRLPITQAVMKWLAIQQQQRGWRNSTTLTKAATAQGALRLAPLYFQNAPTIIIKGSLYWNLAMRHLQTAVTAELPNQPKAASQSQVDPIVKQTTPVSRVIEIAWLAAGRVGDVLQLETVDLAMTNEHKAMNIRFRRGKTASKNQYVITVPSPSGAMIAYLEEAQQTGRRFLFPSITTTEVTAALRTQDPLLESRSLRRGRLQQLSKAGAEDAELLLLSRHSSTAMLRRYLSFGEDSGENQRLVTRTQQLLGPTVTEEEEDEEKPLEEEQQSWLLNT